VTRRRRGHGEGTIYHRPDGRWEAVVDLGWQDGKRRRKYLYGRTRREVAEKLARALKARQEHVPFVSERTTVEQYLVAWLELIRPTIQDSTWRRYEQYVRLHLVPSIGKVRLVKLQPEHLQRMYGERIGKGLSRTSAVHLHRAIHRALALAVRWGYVPRNVAALVEPPRMPHYEFTTLSPQQARTFLQALRGRRLEALYLVAIMTGMREGELLGLRWSDVDLTTRSIRIRRSRARHGGAGGETKTPESRRQVLIPDLAVQALVAHQERQAAERQRRGAIWDDLDLVFPNTIGRPISPQNLLRRDLYPLLAAAGLPRVRFHDLRHTLATLLLGRGVHPKVVSEMLGHADVGITLDLYSHVTATMQHDAARNLDALFGGQLGGQIGSADDEAAGRPS
jgi:integrase